MKMEENVSHPSLSKIFNSQQDRRRCFWICLTVIATGIAIYHVTSLTLLFATWPTSVSSTISHNRKQSFPDVTICNLNHLRRSVIAHKSIYAVIGGLKNTNKKGYMGIILGRSLERLGLEDVLEAMSLSAKIYHSHQLNHMLMSCSFNNQPCDSRNFSSMYDYDTGNCFTFNADELVREAGMNHGLELELNVQPEEYIHKFSDTIGLKVIVHEKNMRVFPANDGIVLSPGKHSFISIDKTVTSRHRLSTSCIETENKDGSHNKDLNVFAEYGGFSYSFEACARTCYQRILLSDCGCYDPRIPFNASIFRSLLTKLSEIRSCHVDSEVCMRRIGVLLEENDICVQQCPPSCSTEKYKARVMEGTWPIDDQVVHLVSKYEEKLRSVGLYVPNIHIGNTQHVKQYVHKNFLKLSIYYNGLHHEHIELFSSYTWYNFISEVGGALSLWACLSFLSLAEIVEHLCSKLFKHKEKEDKFNSKLDPHEFLV